jgi:hypothetical protein
MVGFAHLYRPRTLARTWGTRTGFVPNESWLKKTPSPIQQRANNPADNSALGPLSGG